MRLMFSMGQWMVLRLSGFAVCLSVAVLPAVAMGSVTLLPSLSGCLLVSIGGGFLSFFAGQSSCTVAVFVALFLLFGFVEAGQTLSC